MTAIFVLPKYHFDHVREVDRKKAAEYTAKLNEEINKLSIKTGDVVRLKSGGIKMTVYRIEFTARWRPFIDVNWIDAKGEVRHSMFTPEMLEKVQ